MVMYWKSLPATGHAVIPPSYLDEMGHMNVMWYTRLFSEATGGLFELVGMTREYFEANRAGSFALEEHVRYLLEVHAGHSVTVHSRLLNRTAKRMHFIHFLVRDDCEKLSATGEFVSAHVDMGMRRTSPFPENVVQQLDRLVEEHRQLDWAAPICGTMKP